MRWLLLGMLLAQLVPESAQAGGLRTDLSKALIPLDEVISGGPPPDGIPAIDRPRFVQPADAWLKPKEPVLALQVNGDARAYPLQILMWRRQGPAGRQAASLRPARGCFLVRLGGLPPHHDHPRRAVIAE